MQVAEHRVAGARLDKLDLAVGTGSQDLLTKAFDVVAEEGSSILIEAPTYPGSLAYLEPIGCRLVTVPTDGDGLIPEELERTLRNWDEAMEGPRPRVLYTIPTGCNPTGASLTLERRQRLYEIARHPDNDLLILEDDPYYFLQFGGARLPSLFSMDTDGRVVRFDSFSKILSAGLRIGTVTGPKPVVERINLHSQASNVHPSGIAQMLVLALFRHWHVGDKDPLPTSAVAATGLSDEARPLDPVAAAYAGSGLGALGAHVDRVIDFYRSQCDHFVASAKRHLDGLVEYSLPKAGMFVWLRLLGVEDSASLIRDKAREKKVLMVPGTACYPGGGTAVSPHVRAAFSTASPEDMDEALRRLAECIREAHAEAAAAEAAAEAASAEERDAGATERKSGEPETVAEGGVGGGSGGDGSA